MSSCSLSSPSSSSITTTEDQRDGLVPGEESAVRAWLVGQGFRSAEIRREKEFHDIGGFSMHPLARGCYKGELNVCKWLYDNGAAEDITKANSSRLNMKIWRTYNNFGSTPMHRACKGGHLLVCQWVFEVGAAGDITKTNNYGCLLYTSAAADE